MAGAASPPLFDVTVPEALAGARLDRAIAALAPGCSRLEARRLIAAGVVFVAGRRTRICSRAVNAGERIVAEAPARSRAAGEPRLALVHPDLWIVDKPAGMPTEPTRGGAAGTLAEWLGRGHGRAFVTHRLDVATSGLIAVARHADAQAELNRLLAERAVTRRYLAIVSPAPAWDSAVLDEPLDERPAVTRARVAARAGAAAALEIELETGRTRQIRRHLAGAGSPVAGDRAAGGRPAPRLLLHAFALAIPWRGDTLAARSDPPPDLRAGAAGLGVDLPDDFAG